MVRLEIPPTQHPTDLNPDQDNTEALQEKLSANRCFIDRLRTERSELTSERLHLQEQLAEASKVIITNQVL